MEKLNSTGRLRNGFTEVDNMRQFAKPQESITSVEWIWTVDSIERPKKATVQLLCDGTKWNWLVQWKDTKAKKTKQHR